MNKGWIQTLAVLPKGYQGTVADITQNGWRKNAHVRKPKTVRKLNIAASYHRLGSEQ